MMMMKMTNFSALQRTATRYALLSLLLLASLVLEVTSVKTKNGMANTTPYDDKKVVHKRILTEESGKLIFSRNYISVTQADDFTTLFPNGGDTATFLDDFIVRNKSNPQFPIQGSSTTQKGAIFDSSSVEVVNAPEGVLVTERGGTTIPVQFAGNRKLRFIPVDDPHYFFHGQCLATSGILEPPSLLRSIISPPGGKILIPQPVITSHSCKLNLCLGGGGFSCIAIYSGSAFVFNLGKGIALNNARSLPAPRNRMVQAIPLTFEAPPLPPPFPGTIIGGTGTFEGIEGSVSIATIAGTTGPVVSANSGPKFVGGLKPIGSIVQVISVKSNMPLPPGP